MSQGLKTIADKILEMTNGGLDIIQEIYPQATPNKNFRIREDDKNASCSIYKKQNSDRYRINDFGGSVKSEDCFGLYALEKGIDYGLAILEIARQLQAKTGVQLLNEKTRIFKPYYTEWKIK